VEDLKDKLEVTSHWTSDCDEWKEMDKQLHMREYQLALDHPEGLVVLCLFELGKLNQSGTGILSFIITFFSLLYSFRCQNAHPHC
jgi:hypothetical protein